MGITINIGHLVTAAELFCQGSASLSVTVTDGDQVWILSPIKTNKHIKTKKIKQTSK